MYLARSLSALALFCIASRGALTNFTLDDTSPLIAYPPPVLLRCSPANCPPDQTDYLHNGTSTITEGSIIFGFTGSALYVYLGVEGTCVFTIDGVEAGEFSTTGTFNYMSLGFMNDSMPDAPHILAIYPSPNAVIQLDYIIFSHNVASTSKSRRNAIIGGIIGGITAVAILSFAAFLLRRRQKQKRLFTHGVPLGEHWPDKPSIQLVGMGNQK
ncbi:hypothetical protein K438DRAFT_1850531 [Mycena galopus ATCC 62051]|nr:hypothetical protein K438DRAFT_1850531 [Mycena galopus ATCC 62051]